MLYNPKRNAMSLDNLIAWLEQQPYDGTYEYQSITKCLLGQYFEACGYTAPLLGSEMVYDRPYNDWNGQPLPRGFNWIAQAERGTFGNALERARAIRDCASAP